MYKLALSNDWNTSLVRFHGIQRLNMLFCEATVLNYSTLEIRYFSERAVETYLMRFFFNINSYLQLGIRITVKSDRLSFRERFS